MSVAGEKNGGGERRVEKARAILYLSPGSPPIHPASPFTVQKKKTAKVLVRR